MKKFILTLTGIVVFTFAFCQLKHPVITTAATPEAAGFSSQRLKRIDTVL